MKKIKISFLFFYSYILISVLSCITNKMYSQVDNDSLYYYYNLIASPKNNADLRKAYFYYEKHKDESLKKKDTLQVIQDLRQIAIIENTLGFFHESEISITEALNLLDNSKFEDSITIEIKVGIYNHLGKIYRNSGQYDKALYYYNKILTIDSDSLTVNAVLNNRAYVYLNQNKYRLAVNEFTVAFENSLSFNDDIKTARILTNLGLAQSKLDNPEGLSNMFKALAIKQKESYTSGIITSYLRIAEYYKDRNKKKDALKYIDKALKIAKESKNGLYIENALSSKIDLNSDPDVIYYKKLRDSIKKADQQQKNKFISNKYEFFKEKERADKNQIDKERAKYQSLLFQALVGLIVLLSLFLYFILRQKHKKEKLQQVFSTENRISKKVHDEVANDVYQVMTRLQNEYVVEEEVIDELEQIYHKTRDISKEHGILNVKENFEQTFADLFISYQTEAVNVITKGISEIRWNILSEEKKITIYKVLQELMINMRKHSHASIVVLSFKQVSKKTIISYTDNGVGCDLKKSNGLQNVETRIELINGSITFDSEIDKGFKVTINI